MLVPGFRSTLCSHLNRLARNDGSAYVNVVLWAESAQYLEERVTVTAQDVDCIVREIEEIELLQSALQQRGLSGRVLHYADRRRPAAGRGVRDFSYLDSGQIIGVP